MNNPLVVPMKVSEQRSAIDMTVSAVIYVDYPEYGGATTVTPSQQMQILETEGTLLRSNITIDPIPNNYGLVTWDGSVLTVS